MTWHLGKPLEMPISWYLYDEYHRNLPDSKEQSEVTKQCIITIALMNHIGMVYFKGLKAVIPFPELE